MREAGAWVPGAEVDQGDTMPKNPGSALDAQSLGI